MSDGKIVTARCRICRENFDFRVTQAEEKARVPEPDVCGASMCQAKGHWTPERWAAQRDMADAREVAGVELAPLDIEARRRDRGAA